MYSTLSSGISCTTFHDLVQEGKPNWTAKTVWKNRTVHGLSWTKLVL